MEIQAKKDFFFLKKNHFLIIISTSNLSSMGCHRVKHSSQLASYSQNQFAAN